MILAKNKWKILYPLAYSDQEVIDILYKLKGIDDYVKYYNLGFKDFNDPFLFKNMDIVIKKIRMSIRNNEKILIYGDYDVDGITAVSILYRTLKMKGANVSFEVPNRFETGYGLTLDNVNKIVKDGYSLVITVDNGITSVEEIDELVKRNVQVILTDHHEPKEIIPHTDYIVHSYLYHDYPFESLCGAGVAFKIAEALDKDFARKFVDLAMLGTIADMMPLVGENKAIINEGLEQINHSYCEGLSALLKSLNLNVRGIRDISYNIAPKLNALGRIGDASIAIDLLTTSDEERIKEDIKSIFDADRLRKELTIQNTELAYKLINPDDQINLIYSSSFFEGVLGIIAQKVIKKTGKITGVFTVDDNNNAKGSFRTIGEYNLLDMLEKNKDLLEKFGGHEKACGVTMKASNIKDLKERLSLMIKSDITSVPEVEVALSLNHTLINSDFYHRLENYDLDDTTFLFEGIEVVQSNILINNHTKIKGKLKNGEIINIIIFNDPSLNYNIASGDIIDFIGELNINYQSGYLNLQIIASDYEVRGIQVIDYRKRNDFKEAEPYFDKDSGLVIQDKFDNLSELSLLIKEQSPNIIYLAPLSIDILPTQITNMIKLKEAIYIISTSVKVTPILLQKELRISRPALDTIITIFKELNLVSATNNEIQSLPREKGKKVDLASSPTYKLYQESEEVSNLLYGPSEKIKEFVLQSLE